MCDTEQIFYGALFTLEFYVFNQLFCWSVTYSWFYLPVPPLACLKSQSTKFWGFLFISQYPHEKANLSFINYILLPLIMLETKIYMFHVGIALEDLHQKAHDTGWSKPWCCCCSWLCSQPSWSCKYFMITEVSERHDNSKLSAEKLLFVYWLKFFYISAFDVSWNL